MDDSVWGLILGLIIDILLFSCEFFAFSVYRKYRSRPIYLQLDQDLQLKVPVFSQSTIPFWALLKNVWEVPYDQICYYIGIQGQLFLAFHLVIGKCVGLMAIIGVGILMPIYIMGDSQIHRDMNNLAIAHIISQESLMVSVLVFFFVYSVMAFAAVALYIREITYLQSLPTDLMCSIDRYTVEIKGIPHSSNPVNVGRNIFSLLAKDFSNEIRSVYVVPDLARAYRSHVKLLTSQNELERFKEHQEITSERVKIKKFYDKEETDAIGLFESKSLKYTQNKNHQLEQGKKRCSGVAYLQCQSPLAAYKVVEHFKGQDDALRSKHWKLRIAPAPGQINWQNFEQHHPRILLVRIFLLLIFIVVFFLLITPATVLQFFTYILNFLGLKAIVLGIFGQLLPSVILLFYQSVIVRHSVLKIVKREKLSSKSDQIVSCMKKYLLVMVTYTFIVPLVGLQAIALLSDPISSTLSQWRQSFANNSSLAGLFFTLFIMHLTFLKNGADFLQIPKLIRVKMQQSRALNEKEKLLAYEAYQFRWAYQYGVSISAFFIILAFSVSYPLILVVGCLFFYSRVRFSQYFTAKYNLLCFYCVVKTTTGSRIPEMIVSSLLIAILIFQLFTCGLILLNPTPIFIAISSVLMVASIVCFVVLYMKRMRIEKELKKTFGKNQKEDKILVGNSGIQKYFHPLQVPNECFVFNKSKN